MHRIRIEHGRCCMHNNQLPTKSPFEVKDNPILLLLVASKVLNVILSPLLTHFCSLLLFLLYYL